MENKSKRLAFPKKQEIRTDTLYYLSAEDVLSNISGNNKYNRKSGKRDSTTAKFTKTMLNGEWWFNLTIITILVNDLSVANGWHRIMAIMNAREKDPDFNPYFFVRFIKCDKEKDIKEVIAIENGYDARDWNTHDYCSVLADDDNPAFCTLRELCLTEAFTELHTKNMKPLWGRGAVLLGASYSDFKKYYKSGDWKLDEKDIKEAPKRYYQVVQLIDAFEMPKGNNSWLYLTQAWVNCSSRDEEFSKRLKRLPGGFESLLDAVMKMNHTEKLPDNHVLVWEKRFRLALTMAENWNK